MLNYNKELEWSHFTNEPISIPQSTLSQKLNRLMNKGYIIKVKKEIEGRNKKVYQITPLGKKRFIEITENKDLGRKIKYPPRLILDKKRNYAHWIIWMLYNNASCKWSDFKQDPVSINQTSLSNNLNSLMEDGFISKDNISKEYNITPRGRTEYYQILKLYDLDRQSILEEESRRIEEITKNTNDFFNKYEIKDAKIKFRFLNNILKLDVTKGEDLVKSKEEFNKIILFLSFNHPDEYPEYIIREKFCSKYDLSSSTLNFFVEKIVDSNFFDIKFFKLEVFPDKEYYFRAEEKLERMLRAIIDDYIARFTYLNKLNGIQSTSNQILNINSIINDILDEITGILFHKNLRDSLRNFIPDYIKYLAYKIETEQKKGTSKLESLFFQTMLEDVQGYNISTTSPQADNQKYPYTLNYMIFSTLDIYNLSKLNFMRTHSFKELFNPSNQAFLSKFEDLINVKKVGKAKILYENHEGDFNDLENLIIKDIVATYQYKFEESLDLTNIIIQENPENYIGYLLQSITYFFISEYKLALKIVEEGLHSSKNNLLICQKAQTLTRLSKYDEACNIIDDALINDKNNVFLIQSKFMVYVNNRTRIYEDSPDAVLDIIDTAIKLDSNNKELLILKAIALCMIKSRRYNEAKKLIKESIVFNYLKKNPRIDTTALFILVYTYLARENKFEKALKLANTLNTHYPNEIISFLTKALVHGYNLIHEYGSQKSSLEVFLGIIERTILLDPIKQNKARYYQFKAMVLHETKAYDDAIKSINNAIELESYRYDLQFNKINFLMTSNRNDEALRLINEFQEVSPRIKLYLNLNKSFIFYVKEEYEDALETLEDSLKDFPEFKHLINNKAVILGKLKREKEAFEAMENLIELGPLDGNSYDSYGELLLDFGKYEEAIVKFEKAIELDPTGWYLASTYMKMGRCYKNLGDHEKEEECINKSKELERKMLPSEVNLYGSEPK
ncbi:MAG: hypothetical protein ACW98D_12280 [Promethearchaeota archaeon]|jgi:tetratricopeptide (TPR) repeat protein/DNA-binding PadR family transcriptional regulator